MPRPTPRRFRPDPNRQRRRIRRIAVQAGIGPLLPWQMRVLTGGIPRHAANMTPALALITSKMQEDRDA